MNLPAQTYSLCGHQMVFGSGSPIQQSLVSSTVILARSRREEKPSLKKHVRCGTSRQIKPTMMTLRVLSLDLTDKSNCEHL
mmetsp:Transcript_26417/g.36880  ORF Transcript_26417/g.36880 Transcript_26417/m.36880 type:complete len:81 (+) Transcript_26417:827-1069(+)